MIINADNDYLIGLKENQPKLYKMAQTQFLQSPPLSCATAIDSRHSRIVKRTCQVFAVPESLPNQWAGLKTFVVVERQGERDRQPFHECQFYICSQHLEAQQLLADTQGHWGIENRLHWVKDVTFSEDFPLRRGDNALVNWAILHSFFITIRSPDFLVFELSLKHNVPYPTNSKRFFLCLYETTLPFPAREGGWGWGSCTSQGLKIAIILHYIDFTVG